MAKGCAIVDATGDYISLASGVPTDNITVAGWFYQVTRNSGANQHLIQVGSTFGVRYGSGNQTILSGPGALFSPDTVPSTGGWIYVAVTLNVGTTQFRGYIFDDTYTLYSSADNAQSDINPTLIVVGNNAAHDACFLGRIAQVRVWNSVLTQAQLATEAASTTPVISAVSSWEDDPSASSWINASTGGYTVSSAYFPPNYPSASAAPLAAFYNMLRRNN